MLKIKDPKKLVERALALPREINDLRRGSQVVRNPTKRAEQLLAFFKPVLDQVDWTGGTDGMAETYRKAHAKSAQIAACVTMANHLNEGGLSGLKMEASLAGVDLPTFTTQLLLTTSRAYATLFTLQLFGMIPLNGPTGRMHFKDFLYDSDFGSSTPAIVAGDRTDSKFNKDFYQVNEGVRARKLRMRFTNLDVSTRDYRVAAEWSDAFEDDARAVYNTDGGSEVSSHLDQEMNRVVDRHMISRLIFHVPAANKISWTAQPGASPNYSTLTPSEQDKYDERLLREGILPVIKKIRDARKWNNDGDPTWAVCGTTFALRVSKLGGFQMFGGAREMDLQRGTLRDFGQMSSLGIRFLVDPSLGEAVTGGEDKCYFGRKPSQRGDVGLYWLPYVNLQPTRDWYDPEIGQTVKAVRSRFGVAEPNTATNANSGQLADVYGELTVV